MKPQASSQPRRAAAAAFIGTMIEWYDFYIYATAAALDRKSNTSELQSR